MTRPSAADIALAIDRAASRRLARMVGKLVAPLLKLPLPHAVAWRLRQRIWNTPSAIAVYRGNARAVAGDRLLLIGNDLSRSGAPQVLAEIATLMVGDHDVTLLSPADGPWRQPLVAAGVTVIVGPWLQSAAAPLLRALAPATDRVLCNTVVTVPAIRTLAPVVPTIWYFHEVGHLQDRLAESAELRNALALPARIWAVSDAGRRSLAVHRPDTATVRYGVHPLPGSGHGTPPGLADPLTIGVFGSIEPRKGQDLLLDALARLDRVVADQIRVVVHGRVLDADFDTALRARAATVPNVVLGAELSADDYAAAVIACDAVIIPSRDDPMPIIASDALGAGRVVLCTRACGSSSLLVDGVSGFIADAPEPAAMADMISQAVLRRHDWPSIGAAGRAVFDANFSIAIFEATLRREIATLRR